MARAVLSYAQDDGSGKSTTLASMIDNINAGKTDAYNNIEDPNRISAQGQKVNRQPKRSGKTIQKSFSKACGPP